MQMLKWLQNQVQEINPTQENGGYKLALTASLPLKKYKQEYENQEKNN